MTFPRSNGLLPRLTLQPQRTVAWLGLLVALVLCAMVANDLSRDYTQQISAANAKTSSLTQLLEEHARQAMRRVELSLSMAAQEVQSQAQTRGQLTPLTGSALQAYLPQDGLIASFAVFDADGRTVVSTLTNNPADLPLARDRDFYRAHLDASQNGLFLGQSVKSRISGLWIMPVSIKLEGAFNGTLMAAIDPEYFQHLYRSIDSGENGVVTLLTVQGWAVARWPFTSEVADKNWLQSALFSQHLPAASEGSVQEPSMVDGAPVVYSYRALKEYPLVVMWSLAREDILRPWRTRALFECAGLVLVLLFLGGFTVRLMAELRRRVDAESALQLSEISVLKSSLPTLWIGSDARILRVNQAACELHGLSEAQMLRMTIPDLNPGMPLQDWPAHWQRLRQARNMRFETRHLHSSGSQVPVEAELNFIEFDGREYNFAFLRDLTVRQQAQAEIQRSAATLRGAIDAVDEAFVLFDADDRLVYCNNKYQELYPELRDMVLPGVRFEDLMRAGAQRGLYRESVGREEEWIAARLRAHREGNEARVQKHDDGRVLRVIDRKTPEGNVVGIRVDITELVRATEEAQEASRTKSQFLANMSHEIRTPMNAIMGLLALLQNTELSPVQRDYAAKTTSAAQSLLGLLNDILDFSKVEAGKMELDPQPMRLDRMLQDLAVLLSSSMSGKSIEVLFDIDPQVPAVVVADAMRLQQVLVNLGSNAIKFTTQGHVVLRLRSLPQDAARHAQSALIEFSVQDSGIGIAAEKQQHIFTGFSQAEASTTRRFGGTGLGLAICKRLVELMGGTLGLQSQPGVGSTFSFSLVLPRASGADMEPPPHPHNHGVRPLAGMRILVVEDNLINQQVAQELLHTEGALVSLAGNGQLGVDAVAASEPPFDVVLMDIQMPVLDGYGATRKIRGELGLTQLPIVAMTANALDSDRQACLAAGMHAHVGKPFDIRHLVAVLLAVTGRHAVPTDVPQSLALVLSGQPLQLAAEQFRQAPAFSSPYLDVAAAVERLSGMTALYSDVLQDFIVSLAAVEETFRQAASNGALQELAAQMHTLKGIAATLGAIRLSDHAGQLEKLFRHSNQGLVALDHLPGLLALIALSKTAAEEAVHSLQPASASQPMATPGPLPHGPTERATALAFLQELSALLRASNLAALDYFKQRKAMLDALPAAAVNDMHLALQALDLESARQLCEIQMAALARA